MKQSLYKGVYRKMIELGEDSVDDKYQGWTADKLPMSFRPGDNFLYYGASMRAKL